MAITDRTRKLLWGRAGNRCAICRRELTRVPAGAARHTIVGEEAHLVAREAGGARAHQAPPGGELDGYANLIVLCREDHRLIDDQPEVYPVSRLIALKAEHERWVTETLEEARETDANRWPDGLARLRRESIARCVESWQALRVPLDVATALARDPTVGARDELCAPDLPPVVVLVGDVGSGKTLAGERRHQADIDAALASGRGAAVPVWLRARDTGEGLEHAVGHLLLALGVPPAATAVSIVLDGLDEAGPAAAAALLGEARMLVQSRPGSRAVATTRLLESVGNADERVSLAPLSDEDAAGLIARAGGGARGSLWSFAEPIREAARRPLFAIALARVLAEQPSYAPATPGELIDRMVRAAAGNAWHEMRDLLVALAVAALRRDGGAVRTAEIVPAHRLERLLATRLVVEDRGRLRFPLIVFAQWFAADAVLGGDVDVSALFDVPGDLELWRYPLAVALTRASESLATSILAPLAGRNPAFASLVVTEAARQWAADGSADAGTWAEAGGAVVSAERAWVAGLGPLARMIAPLRAGALRPLGVRVPEPGRLATAWYGGSEARDAVFELEPSFFALDASQEYGPAKEGTLPGGPAWAWRWTRDELAYSLTRLLAQRRLVLAETALEHEAVWTVALRALGHSALATGPVDVTRLLEAGPDTHALISRFPSALVPAAGLQPALARHMGADGMLRAPWPGPDRPVAAGYVWGPYSAERIRERAEAIFAAALRGYEQIVRDLFAPLATRMRIATTLPAVARGSVTFSDRPGFEGHPLVRWHLDPLPAGEISAAAFELGDAGPPDVIRELNDVLKRERPEAARWITATGSYGVLDVFHEAPAAQQAYEWLIDDLRSIGWVTGTASGGWPRDAVPRLA